MEGKPITINIPVIVPAGNCCLAIGAHGRVVCDELYFVSSTTPKCRRGFTPSGNTAQVRKDVECGRLQDA